MKLVEGIIKMQLINIENVNLDINIRGIVHEVVRGGVYSILVVHVKDVILSDIIIRNYYKDRWWYDVDQNVHGVWNL